MKTLLIILILTTCIRAEMPKEERVVGKVVIGVATGLLFIAVAAYVKERRETSPVDRWCNTGENGKYEFHEGIQTKGSGCICSSEKPIISQGPGSGGGE